MRRTLRSYRNNPIDPTAAQELVSYVRGPNGGGLRVQFTGTTGTKWDLLVSPLRIQSSNGRVFLVVEDIRHPDGFVVDKFEGKQISIDLSTVETMAYRASNEPEAIVSSTGAFRFLSPRFLRSVEIDGKKFVSHGHYLAYLGTAAKHRDTVLAAGEGFDFPSPSKTAIEFRREENGEPSPVAIAAVNKAMFEKFQDLTLARMLAATGARPIEIPDTVYDVPLAPILTSIRQTVLSAGVQPTGQLPSERLVVPEVQALTAEAEGFRVESEEEYEGRLRRILAVVNEQSQAGGLKVQLFEGVPDLRSDSELEIDALVYVDTGKFQDTTNLRVLKTCGLLLPYKVITLNEAGTMLSGGDETAETWVARHPQWQRIGVAYTPGKRAGPVDIYVASLMRSLSDRSNMLSLQVQNLFRLRSAQGDLLIPFDGTITDVSRRASDVAIKFQTEDTAPRLQFVTAQAIWALKKFKSFAQGLLNRSPSDIEATKRLVATSKESPAYVERLSRLEVQLKRLVGVRAEPEQEEEEEDIPQTAMGQALMAAMEKYKKKMPPAAEPTGEAKVRGGSKLDRLINEAELLRDAAASPDSDAVQSAMFYSKSLRDAISTYNRMLGLIHDARRVYKDVRDLADRFTRRGGAPGTDVHTLAQSLTLRLQELQAVEKDVEKSKNEVVVELRGMGPLGSQSENEVIQAIKTKKPPQTAEGFYAYSGSPPTLYAHEVFTLPRDRAPIGQVIGREIRGSGVVELGGARDDAGKREAEYLTADSMLVIYQMEGVTCEPVRLSYLPFGKTIVGREKLVDIVNTVMSDYIQRSRNQAIAAALMSKKDMTEALDTLSQALDEEGQSDARVVNYVEQCRREAEEDYKRIVSDGERDMPGVKKRLAETAKSMGLRPTEFDEEQYMEEIKKFALQQASYKMPAFTTAPVLYYILLDSKEKKAYTTDEVGIFPSSNREAANEVAIQILKDYPQAKIRKLASLPRFMSDGPLDIRQCDLFRPLSGRFARALLEKVVPVVRDGGVPTYKDQFGQEKPVFAWERPFYGVSAKSREAMAAARRLSRTTTQAASRSGGGVGGKIRVGRLRSGAVEATTGVGTLTGGTTTGRYKYGEGGFSIVGERRGVGVVSALEVAGSKPRLSRYLDRLIEPRVRPEEKAVKDLTLKEASMLRSSILGKYGSEVQLRAIRDVQERAVRRRQMKEDGTYEDPREVINVAAERAQDEIEEKYSLPAHHVHVDFEAQRDYDFEKAQLEEIVEEAVRLKELNAHIENLAVREKAQKRQARIEKSIGIGTKATLALGRKPTAAELQAMQEAVRLGEDPMSVFQTKTPKTNPRHRRNAGGEGGDDFGDLFEELGPEGEAAGPAPSAPPPPAGPPPSREAGRRVYESFFAPRSAESTIPEDDALLQLRAATEASWSAFASALRAKGTRKDLPDLLDKYLEDLLELEKALDRRDTAILNDPKKGREALQELLRNEAALTMRAVQKVYARTQRDADGTVSAAARVQFARDVGLLLDYMGRPVAPPSEEELRNKGLVDPATGEVYDFATAKTKELRAAVIRTQQDIKAPPSAPASLMGSALTFQQLEEAGRLAARAEKVKAGGVSLSAISCKVMQSGQEVRRRINREVVNRIFDTKTYFGGRQTRAGARMGAEGDRKKILIWFSPDASHAIFFVNNFGVCEFHSENVLSLLSEVFHYTVDWFNDPRKGAERRDYAVFVGRSGFPFIYMIWGGMFRDDPRVNQLVFLADQRGPMSVEELANRMQFVGAFHSGGVANIAPDKTTRREVRELVTAYISPNTALKLQGGGDSPEDALKGYLTADATDYLNSMASAGYGVSPTVAYDLLRTGPEVLRTSTIRLQQILAKQAQEGKRKAVTLFYPVLYGENGQLLTSTGPTGQGPDADTGPRILDQIRAYAKALTADSTVRIIDGSIWRKAVARSAANSPSIRASNTQVPSPWATMRAELGKLGKNNVKIELVVPQSPDILGDFEAATGHDDALPDVEVVPADPGDVYVNLRTRIAPGSTLVLWQDQDRSGYDRVFGEKLGASAVAAAIAEQLPFIKRVVVEAGVHESDGVDSRPGDPERLREEVLQGLAAQISRAGSNLQQVLAVVKLEASDLPRMLRLVESLSYRELAEDVMEVVAQKYGIQPGDQFIYGNRTNRWSSAPVVANRGLSRRR